MNPQKSPEITVQTLLALRKEDDAVRLITESLRVKEMGPADHIRTKHEVKAFVESGDIKQARERASAGQMITIRLSERQQIGRRLGE
jgi:hypothetical protein